MSLPSTCGKVVRYLNRYAAAFAKIAWTRYGPWQFSRDRVFACRCVKRLPVVSAFLCHDHDAVVHRKRHWFAHHL
jgi:hypothetical protein